MCITIKRNDEASKHVLLRHDFQNGKKTLFGRNGPEHYTVYSYGPHWPLFIYDEVLERWFENAEDYKVKFSDPESWVPGEGGRTRAGRTSGSTVQHHRYARPKGVITTKLSAEDMIAIDKVGLVQAVLAKVEVAA